METKRYVRRVVFAVALAIVALATFAGVAMAAGPYTRWIPSGTSLYADPDLAADITRELTKTMKVEVNVQYGWGEITSPTEIAGEYVQTSQLMREEPAETKHAAFLAKRMGDLTVEEYLALQGYAPTAPVSLEITPAGSAPAPALPTTSTYTVVAGDSLSKIAAKYNVDWRDLAKANNIVSPYTIEIGQLLTIPSGPAATPALTTSVPTTVSGWPTTAEAFLALATRGQPTPPADKSWIPVQLGEIHRPVGEVNAWAVAREKDKSGNIVPFWISNFSGRAQDGYCMVGGKYATGTPANFAGLSQGVTFRP